MARRRPPLELVAPKSVGAWHARFAVAAVRSAEEKAKVGPDRRRAVAVSLSMIEAARAPGSRVRFNDGVRRREEEVVRATWRALRASMLGR